MSASVNFAPVPRRSTLAGGVGEREGVLKALVLPLSGDPLRVTIFDSEGLLTEVCSCGERLASEFDTARDEEGSRDKDTSSKDGFLAATTDFSVA